MLSIIGTVITALMGQLKDWRVIAAILVSLLGGVAGVKVYSVVQKLHAAQVEVVQAKQVVDDLTGKLNTTVQANQQAKQMITQLQADKEQTYHTKLKGTLALTDSYLTEKALQKEKGLYKFIWVRNGSITVEIDHQEMILTQDEVISLTHLQHLEFKSIDGEYLTLLFNSNFYCIYGNDHEVSCSGFLFNGSSHLIRFTLNEKERKELDTITEALENEFTVSDSLQEEMLRILLKRFIIQCTRIARHRIS